MPSLAWVLMGLSPEERRRALTMIKRQPWKPSVADLERLIHLHLISCEPRTSRQGAHDAAMEIHANMNPYCAAHDECAAETKEG